MAIGLRRIKRINTHSALFSHTQLTVVPRGRASAIRDRVVVQPVVCALGGALTPEWHSCGESDTWRSACDGQLALRSAKQRNLANTRLLTCVTLHCLYTLAGDSISRDCISPASHQATPGSMQPSRPSPLSPHLLNRRGAQSARPLRPSRPCSASRATAAAPTPHRTLLRMPPPVPGRELPFSDCR